MRFDFRKHYDENPELYGQTPLPSGKNIDGGPAVDHNKEFKEEIRKHRGMSFGADAKFKTTKGNEQH